MVRVLACACVCVCMQSHASSGEDWCYKVYVRPVVEYASAVWDSSSKTTINKIENIQRKAVGFVFQNYREESSAKKKINK